MMRKMTPSFQIRKKWFKWKVDLDDQFPKNEIAEDKILRIAAVGGGDIGVRNAQSVQNAAGAKLVATCDIDPEIIRDFSINFEAPAVREYEQILARKDIDAVLLSIPHFLHAPFTIKAAEAGKHVLLEKPLGVNLDDATTIVETCQKAGVRLTVNFSFRYRPNIELARQIILEEGLGKVCGTQINLFQYKGASYWAGGFTSRAAGDWRASKEKAGGGVLITTMCHALDYLRYCTGLEISRIFSEYGTYASPIRVEDAIAAAYQYDNGAIGSVASSTFWRPDKRDEVIIWGSHGVLRIEDNSNLIIWLSRKWRNLSPGKEYRLNAFPSIDYTSKWIERFAWALAHQEPHEISGIDGWVNNAVIEAAYKSRDLGRSAVVDQNRWTKSS